MWRCFERGVENEKTHIDHSLAGNDYYQYELVVDSGSCR